jgi:hypothetical protein
MFGTWFDDCTSLIVFVLSVGILDYQGGAFWVADDVCEHLLVGLERVFWIHMVIGPFPSEYRRVVKARSGHDGNTRYIVNCSKAWIA